MLNEFNDLSYSLHKENYKKAGHDEKLLSWKKKDTIDYWRHLRMYKSIDPLIESYPDAKWLTVGDGRYGTDANYILGKGIKQVLASDISDTYLELAKVEGFITEYSVQNAEKLSFENSTFDFVLCKESYHHFPRPGIALYEMLRVAKKAVVLIEPQDQNILIPSRFSLKSLLFHSKQTLKNVIKKIIRRSLYYNYGQYETVGNYVYTISEREIEKVALGLDYPFLAFKMLGDYYEDGVEFETISENSVLYNKVNNEIRKTEKQIKNGKAAGLLVAMIFKEHPDKKCLDLMKEQGFVIRELPRNPYT